MRNYVRSIIVFAIATSVATSCLAQQKPAAASSRSADEKAIRTESESWSRTAGSKDGEKFVSVYSSDASVFPPNHPVVTGKANILAFWKTMMATPGFSVSFGPTHVEVAKSGDMAYETGTYKLTENDANGKPVTEIGKYVVAWKKQADGKWKAAADIFNADK